jgi:hypothetical protein
MEPIPNGPTGHFLHAQALRGRSERPEKRVSNNEMRGRAELLHAMEGDVLGKVNANRKKKGWAQVVSNFLHK